MSPPRPPSLQLLSLNINGLRGRRKRAALFSVLLSGPWHVIALQETHHASQAEAAQWCREGAGSLLLLLTENAVTTLLGHNGLSGAAKDGV